MEIRTEINKTNSHTNGIDACKEYSFCWYAICAQMNDVRKTGKVFRDIVKEIYLPMQMNKALDTKSSRC
jgi:hypothetical protein